MKSMTKKLLVLITGLLLVALALSSCGLDSVETNEVSDEARENFINGLLEAEGAKILYAPSILDEEGDKIYGKAPSGYTKVNKSKGGPTGLTDMYLVLKNSNYELYMDFETTDIAVLDLKTGYAYHSNPKRDPDTKGQITASLQNSLASPLTLEAYDASGKRYQFNFYQNCLEDGTFYVVKTGDDSIRLIFTIGNDPDKDLFPPVVTKDTYEKNILGALDSKLADGSLSQSKYEEYQKLLNKCYRYITPNPKNKSEELSPEDKERFRDTFPTIDVMSLYISYDKVPAKQKAKVKELMLDIGFTAKDVKKEMEKADYQGPERAVLYTIPVDLTLNKNGLSVSIDSSLVLGPTKQRLYSINVYRGFGATRKVHENSYMIAPDGSGTIIPVAGNLNSEVFKGRVYGADASFNKEYDASYSEQILAPYMILDRGEFTKDYGVFNGGGIVAVMEDGAAQASVVMRPIQGNANPVASINYELIYSERDYRTYSTSSVASGVNAEQVGSGLLLSKDDVSGFYRIQYLFTEGGLSYPEYAAFLRNYYVEKEYFPKDTLSESELPLFIDLLGCVDLTETVIGVPTKKETSLTTYKEALEILTKLKEAGINNVVARYTYWANGGESNTFAKDMDLLKCMGSEDELKALAQYCTDNGMGFFPSVDFLKVSSSENGFSKSQDAARRMNRSNATIVDRFNAHGEKRLNMDEKTLVSSKVSAEIAETYKSSFEEVISNKSIALGTIGKDLHSNYKTNDGVTRAWAEKDHVKILQTFKADGYKIAVTTGNAYTWNYATHIFDLPTGSSEYRTSLGSIPFAQIMLHGYVNYSMEEVNRTGDYETALLLALETGSAFSFRWMANDDALFDNTTFYNYFSINYTKTFDRAVKLYKEAAAVLNDVVNEPITDHAALDAFYVLDHEGLIGWTEVPVPEGSAEGTLPTYEPSVKRVECGGVFATVYGTKKVVIVNYNDHDAELNDRTVIKAKSYLVLTLKEYNQILDGTAYEAEPVPVPPVVDENVDNNEQEG